MMRSRDFVVVGCFVLGSAAGFIACSFPDVTFAPDADAASPSEAGDAGVPTEDGSIPDGAVFLDAEGPPSSDVDPEGGAQNAGGAGDAGKVDTSGCTTCDCDLDGFNRIQADAGCNGGPSGKLPDCDDTNAAIHPGLGFINSSWPPASATSHEPAGDWDCSGATTYQFEHDAGCGLGSSCKDGFVGTPACGGTSDYVTCSVLLLPLGGILCSEKTHDVAGVYTQACH